MNKQEIEKAIETLKDMKGVFDTRSHKQYSLPALDLAISALEQQLNNGWIPVSDGDYIVTIKGGEVIECQSLKI